MRKKYIVPLIAVEHYELTQSIAACTTKINFLSSECVLEDPDATDQMKDLASSNAFVENHCTKYPTGMDSYDKICYHTNANAAFSS